VFAGFSVAYLGEPLKPTTIVGFVFVLIGAFFVFMDG
jgi:uncharacterized protein (DUF486 family)